MIKAWMMVPQVLVPVWLPSDITGLLAWHSASDIEGLSDNDDVSTWADLSGNSKDFTQGTAGYCPHYKTNIINSLPALLFDNSDDVMNSPSITGIKTIVIVAKYDGATFGAYNGLVTGPSGNIWWLGNSGDTQWYTGESGGQTFFKDGERLTTSVTNAWHIFLNKTDTAQDFAVRLGQDRSYTRTWKGYVAEVCIYDTALTGDNLSNLILYLSGKYNITVIDPSEVYYSHNADDITAVMSGADAGIVTQSTEYDASFAGWKAFDHDAATCWSATSSSSWIKWNAGAGNGKSIHGYSLTVRDNATNVFPSGWTLKGSNDDSSWDTLDTKAGQVVYFNGQMRKYTITDSSVYQYFMFEFTGSAWTQLAQIELLEL
jgi:hypothetical protein